MITPAELSNRYNQLRQRVAMHIADACEEVSVPLPSDFENELAFYRLVNWSYIVLNEAAKLPLSFLMALPPLQANSDLRNEVARMRTFVAHNLDVTSNHDVRTRAFAHSWFRSACGAGTPITAEQFAKCSSVLGERVDWALRGAIEACDTLDHPTDGPDLVSDLRNRIDLNWEAHKFDGYVEAAAAALGNPKLDLLELRRKNLDSWRKTVAMADENAREEALRLKIEASLISAIGDTLPISIVDVTRDLAIAGPEALITALLILRDVRRYSPTTLVTLIERVSADAISQTLK